MIFNHYKFTLLQYLRQPSYMVSTMVFPAFFFLMFAKENAKTEELALFLMGSFAAFAVLSVCFLQFGVGVAQERASQWNQFLKTLPFHPGVSMIARVFTALTFALFAAWVVVFVVLQTTDAQWNLQNFLHLNFALVLGGIPFCLMGLALGRVTTESSALPICNLFYLSLSFAGGLWMPPNALADSIQGIVDLLPTYHYGLWVRSTLLNESISNRSLYFLFGTFVVMILINFLIQKRRVR
tara:strand:- start:11556 stop:12272 length:717 start_codon:yes stop_codon:yes gene_type:complete